jgi:murein L,D-transpeptidase YcbB/YkuD
MRSHLTTRIFLAALIGIGAAAGSRAEDAGESAVPIAAPALAPEAAAFRAALRLELADRPEAERAAIDRFFARRDYAPFWTEGGRAEALIAALEDSSAQGLPAGRYDLEALDVPDAADRPAAAQEAAATVNYLKFAGDLAAGVLPRRAVGAEIGPRTARPGPAALLAGLEAGTVAETLRGLEPADPDYRRLIGEKARLEQLAQAGTWGPPVPDGPTLHPGDVDPRVADLRGRLARLGYLQASGEAGPAFDPALTGAVQRFQRDHALEDDGVVGTMTLAAINAPVETRLAQVVVNLERLRWTSRELGERYLYVNIPDFSVNLMEGGQSVWRSKVVVGKARVTETPEFSGEVRTMVVNPTWHIPDSIAIRDYLPKLQRDPMVLKRQGIRLLTRRGTEINPRLVDFTQYTPANFPFRIKQRPSDDNALGQVKFLFPNEHSVYMHDTPHRELFARGVRAFSNGCIRLEKPVELAEMLLTGQVPDPAGYYRDLVAAGKERAVKLERTVPVLITYRTVTFEPDGTARYREDVYGRDAAVFRALEQAGVTLPAAQG